MRWIKEFAERSRACPVPKDGIILDPGELLEFIGSTERGYELDYNFEKQVTARLYDLFEKNAEIVIPPLLRGCMTDKQAEIINTITFPPLIS